MADLFPRPFYRSRPTCKMSMSIILSRAAIKQVAKERPEKFREVINLDTIGFRRQAIRFQKKLCNTPFSEELSALLSTLGRKETGSIIAPRARLILTGLEQCFLK